MINPLRLDPTRTTMLRKKFAVEMTRRFNNLKRKVNKLLVEDDALGLKLIDPFQSTSNPLVNAGWEVLDTEQKIEAFKKWLKVQIALEIIESHTAPTPAEAWVKDYIKEGFKKGVSRSFDDVRKPHTKSGKGEDKFYAGTKDEFLRGVLNQPVSVDRVRVLVARTYTELEGISESMSKELTNLMTDGLIQGLSPREVARNISQRIDKINRNSALSMARTDVVRAHAEGQLYALERLGVAEVGVSVEWATSGYNVCDLCRPMEKVVLKISEAHGMIPRHRNCKCAFIPAGVGEDYTNQIRSKDRILAAIQRSLKEEIPKRSKRTVAEQRERSDWAGAHTKISKKRDKPIL